VICPNCGTENVAGARFCRTCGNALPSELGSSIGDAAVAAAPEYMGFWIRVVAYLIDAIILGIVNAVIVALLGGDTSAQIIAAAINIVIAWLYFSILWSSSPQASLGMMALGMKVTDLDGGRISFGKATLRYVVQFVLSLLLGIGFIVGALWVAFDARKQALWDKAAGTFVVKKR
jgi:uncharacterized RDD family membrane protein YckC